MKVLYRPERGQEHKMHSKEKGTNRAYRGDHEYLEK